MPSAILCCVGTNFWLADFSGTGDRAALGDDADVDKDENDEGSDAQEKASEVHAGVDGAGVPNTSPQESDVGQDGEGEPSERENFYVARAPSPTSRPQGYERQHGGAQRDGGGGGKGVTGRKAHIRVQEKQQEGDRIFAHDDGYHKSAIAGVRRAEELCYRE